MIRGCRYEDDTDDDEDEEEEEEADDESGLGKVKELQYFRDTLKGTADARVALIVRCACVQPSNSQPPTNTRHLCRCTAYASLGDKHKVLLSMLPAPLQQTCQVTSRLREWKCSMQM